MNYGCSARQGTPLPRSLLLGVFLCEYVASFPSSSLNATSLPLSSRLRRQFVHRIAAINYR